MRNGKRTASVFGWVNGIGGMVLAPGVTRYRVCVSSRGSVDYTDLSGQKYIRGLI